MTAIIFITVMLISFLMMYVIPAAICLIASIKFIHMLQLESYQAPGYIRWLKTNGKKNCWLLILSAVIFLASTVTESKGYGSLVTMLLMLWVNDYAGMDGIPHWMMHAGTREDMLGLADIAFPSFLFCMGMSIPLAIENRLKKGESIIRASLHVLLRCFALLLMLTLLCTLAPAALASDVPAVPEHTGESVVITDMEGLQAEIEVECVLRALYAAEVPHELAGGLGDVCKFAEPGRIGQAVV